MSTVIPGRTPFCKHRGQRSYVTLLSLLVLLLVSSPPCSFAESPAQEATSAATAEVKKQAKKEVKVEGDIPAGIQGRWLVIGSLTPSPERQVTTAALLEVARDTAGAPTVEYRTAGLPAGLTAAVDAALQANAPLTPSTDLLAETASKWDEVTRDVDGGFREVKYRLVMADHFDATFQADERAKDSEVVLIASLFPARRPGERAPIRTDLFFFVEETTPERLRGRHTNFQLVASYVPAPVTLDGTFTAYRLDRLARAGADPDGEAAPLAAAAEPTFWELLRRRVSAFLSGEPTTEP